MSPAGNHLAGFVTADITNERGMFTLAVYVRLNR